MCIGFADAHAFYIDSAIGWQSQYLNENLFVADNAIVESFVGTISVTKSVSIVNFGAIYSDFYIDGDFDVYVQNSGVIKGNFNVAPNGHVVQIVTGPKDLNFIDVSSGFRVWVRGATDISLADVLNISGNPDKIVLENSVLNLSTYGPRVASDLIDNIEIVGDVVMSMESIDDIDLAMPLLRNVSGDGTVSFDVTGINPLYRLASRIDDGNLYAVWERETEYRKVLGGRVGEFLDNLRGSYPNDNLLRAMDSATDMDGLNSVMSQSVRLNPVRLMESVRRMNMLDALGGIRFTDASDFNTRFDVIFSDTSAIYRGHLSGGAVIRDDLSLRIGGVIGLQNTSDDINEFSARLLGGDLALNYDDGMVLSNAAIGFTYGRFDTGPVFDGTGTDYNPTGMAGFASADVGVQIESVYDIVLTPFVGVFADWASVSNDRDSSVLANVGLAANFSVDDFDVWYDYGVRGNVLTDGAIHMAAFVEFYAPTDGVGGGADFAVVHDDNGMGYKISVSAHVAF